MAHRIHWLERLVAERDGQLRALLRRRFRPRDEAADLAQEVYLRLLRVQDPAAIENPESYVFTVALNLARERAVLAGRQRHDVPVDKPEIEAELAVFARPDEEIDASAREAALYAAMAELPERWRDAVILHYEEGLSYAETAARLNVSSHAVKKYIVRALAHFRRRLGASR